MSNLSMVEANLPAGFRFHPRDSELICDYLINKIARCEQPPFLIQVDLNKCEPWDIPESACVGGKEWYFYSQRDRKYATGLRTNRATISGYWKATGKDRPVKRRGALVGMRKTLVFYQGRAPKGKKTDWVMHEFRLEGPFCPPKLTHAKEDWVLCRVFYKNTDQGGNKQQQQPQPQGMMSNNNHDHDTLSSTSLPPLMEPCITFDQTLNNHEDHFEQVPCFSIFSPNQINYNPQLNPGSYDNNNMFGPAAMADMGSYMNTPSNDDKKVLKAVLNHINNNNTTNYIKDSPSFGSSESFLSDVGMPTGWYHL